MLSSSFGVFGRAAVGAGVGGLVVAEFSEGESVGAGSSSLVPVILRVSSLYIERGKRVMVSARTSLGFGGMVTSST